MNLKMNINIMEKERKNNFYYILFYINNNY